MNILLINHYAGSPRHGMEFRPYYFAREWIRNGHDVTIVAAQHSHLRHHSPALGGRAHVEQLDGVRYLWLPTTPYRGNGAARLANMAAFVLQLGARKAALVRRYRPHLVIASSTYPCDIWPARRIARASGARLVHEVHDLWPLTLTALGRISPAHPVIRLMQAAEDYACRHADHVVSLLPHVATHLHAHGLPPGRLTYVPNGVDPAEWRGPFAPLPSALETHLQTLRLAGWFVVGYAGGHGVANALDVLLDAAAGLQDERIAFVLVGDGVERARLQAQAERLGLQHVLLAPPIAKDQVPSLLAQVDAAYLGWRRDPIYRFGIAPNKLLDYMMSACPVLHANAAPNDLVADSGCGLSCAPQDPAALRETILALARLPAASRRAMGQRGREYVLRHLTLPTLAQRFLYACAPFPRAKGDLCYG
jgi:glycosyltransferase involved in cell wall biosynthesis